MSIRKPAARIGLTMRIVQAEGYDEPRDALAQDWHGFMQFALPETLWLPIPNLGNDAVEYFQHWHLDGLILTGGNDIGEAPLRDATESSLISHALSSSLPIVGVCRGLQMLHHHFGGQLRACPPEDHVSSSHQIDFTETFPVPAYRRRQSDVNSYHNLSMLADELPLELALYAQTPENWVESIGIPDKTVIATMWHPEREKPYCDRDRDIMRSAFGY